MSSYGLKPKQSSHAKLPLFLIPIASIIVACIGWSVFWNLASRKAEAVLTAWMAREASVGRNWICPERKIGGFPFEVEISCSNPAFQGESMGDEWTGTLKGFRATSPLLRPQSVLADFQSPFTLKTADGDVSVSLQWRNLSLSLEGEPSDFSRLAVFGEGASVEGTAEGATINANIGDFHASAIGQPVADRTYNFVLAANEVSIPALSERLDMRDPLNLRSDGVITQTNFAVGGKLDERIENWRKSGGHIDLTAARVSSGATKLEARGALDIDDEHRVRGRLNAAFTGLEPALRTLGVDPALITAGSLLTKFLSNAKRPESETDNAPQLPIPVTIADGWLAIGPVRTSIRFPPLY